MRRCLMFALALPVLTLAVASVRAGVVAVSFTTAVYDDEKGRALDSPEGVACGADGLFVVADAGNQRVLQFRYEDEKVSGGTPMKLPKDTHPVRVEIDKNGDVLVFDQRARKIVRLGPDGALVGSLDLAEEIVPVSFKPGLTGDVYVLDIAGNRVVQTSPGGQFTKAISLPADAGPVSDLAIGNDGALYVVNGAKAQLFKAKKTDSSFSVLVPRLEGVTHASYVTTDAKRASLIISNQHGHELVVLDIDGQIIGRRLGIGQKDGRVYYPSQVCMTPGGALIVADRGNNRVQVFGAKQ